MTDKEKLKYFKFKLLKEFVSRHLEFDANLMRNVHKYFDLNKEELISLFSKYRYGQDRSLEDILKIEDKNEIVTNIDYEFFNPHEDEKVITHKRVIKNHQAEYSLGKIIRKESWRGDDLESVSIEYDNTPISVTYNEFGEIQYH